MIEFRKLKWKPWDQVLLEALVFARRRKKLGYAIILSAFTGGGFRGKTIFRGIEIAA